MATKKNITSSKTKKVAKPSSKKARKEPFGRPTKYDGETLNKAKAYINGGYKKRGPVPIMAGLANVLGVTKVTLYEWAKTHKDFSYTLDSLQELQEELLASKGLMGETNTVITKLMLANHGYADASKQELTGKDGAPIETTTLNVIELSDDALKQYTDARTKAK